MTISTFSILSVFGGTAATLFAIIYGLRLALSAAAWPAQEQRKTVLLAAVLLAGWLSLTIALGAAGAYHVGASSVPTIQYGILLPILIGVLLLWRSDRARRVLDAVPQEWIVGIQLYRALGFTFFVLYAAGQLPALFAWPAGAGDIAVGLLAPVVGRLYAQAPLARAGLVRAWNIFGILDLVVAVGTGFMTAPSAIAPIAVVPSSEAMTQLPMVLIPAFLVPLSIVLHIASLVKLNRSEAAVDLA